MKIVRPFDEFVTSFLGVEDLVTILRRDGAIRVELTSKEFQSLLTEYDWYEPVGIDSDSPEDYSGCHVLVDGRWCVQTHHSYYE